MNYGDSCVDNMNILTLMSQKIGSANRDKIRSVQALKNVTNDSLHHNRWALLRGLSPIYHTVLAHASRGGGPIGATCSGGFLTD